MADAPQSPPEDEDGMGPLRSCACGCGATFRMYDNRKREREFAAPGHYFRMLTELYRKARRRKR